MRHSVDGTWRLLREARYTVWELSLSERQLPKRMHIDGMRLSAAHDRRKGIFELLLTEPDEFQLSMG